MTLLWLLLWVAFAIGATALWAHFTPKEYFNQKQRKHSKY